MRMGAASSQAGYLTGTGTEGGAGMQHADACWSRKVRGDSGKGKTQAI